MSTLSHLETAIITFLISSKMTIVFVSHNPFLKPEPFLHKLAIFKIRIAFQEAVLVNQEIS